MPNTVALELEWVLRGYYRFNRDQVGLVFDALLNLPTLQLEDRAAIERPWQGCAPARPSPPSISAASTILHAISICNRG